MRRETSLRARDETHSSQAPVEVRPTLVMKAAQYKQWRWSLFSHLPNIKTIFDQAVTDLVETYEILPQDREEELRKWLYLAVLTYFEEKIRKDRSLTPKQEETSRRKIVKIGDDLLHELCRLYNFDPADLAIPGRHDPRASLGGIDCFALNAILSRAEEWSSDACTTKGDNAAKPALKSLGQHIRDFWVTNCLEDPETAPDTTAGSPYVQFGKYIYFFVDEAADVPRVIQRLKAVEDDPGLAPLKKQAQKNNA